jgi:hypothetical protein
MSRAQLLWQPPFIEPAPNGAVIEDDKFDF